VVLRAINHNHHLGETTLKKTITTIAAAAVLAAGTFAAPALAAGKKKSADPAMHPLPAIGVLPAMLIMDTKKNPKFKPTKPYGKKTVTSVG
jgi:hypothetical protein